MKKAPPLPRTRTERMWGIVLSGRILAPKGRSRLFGTRAEAEEHRKNHVTFADAQVRPILVTPVSSRASLLDISRHHYLFEKMRAEARAVSKRWKKKPKGKPNGQ